MGVMWAETSAAHPHPYGIAKPRLATLRAAVAAAVRFSPRRAVYSMYSPLRALLSMTAVLLGLNKREARKRLRGWKDVCTTAGPPEHVHWVPIKARQASLAPYMCSRVPATQVFSDANKWCEELTACMADAALAVASGNFIDGLISPAQPVAKEALKSSSEISDASAGTDMSGTSQSCIAAGNFYQNRFRASWNNSGTPVSGLLRITGDDCFELTVANLDSIKGGSEGIVSLRCSFDTEPVPGKAGYMRLALRQTQGAVTLEYDSSIFECRQNFMLSCLKRAPGALLSAFNIEVDTKSNTFYCGPRAAVLKMCWQNPVTLAFTEESKIWRLDDPASLPEETNADAEPLAAASEMSLAFA